MVQRSKRSIFIVTKDIDVGGLSIECANHENTAHLRLRLKNHLDGTMKRDLLSNLTRTIEDAVKGKVVKTLSERMERDKGQEDCQGMPHGYLTMDILEHIATDKSQKITRFCNLFRCNP